MDTTTTITTTEGRRPVVTLLLVAALTTAGCGGAGSPFAEWIDTEESIAKAQRDEPRADGRGMPASGSVQQADAITRGPDIPPEAGPEDFVRIALERNPGVRAAEQSVHRLSDRIPQAERLEDPTLFVAPVGEMAETAADIVACDKLGVFAFYVQRKLLLRFNGVDQRLIVRSTNEGTDR